MGSLGQGPNPPQANAESVRREALLSGWAHLNRALSERLPEHLRRANLVSRNVVRRLR